MFHPFPKTSVYNRQKMSNQFLLKTDGYQVLFNLTHLEHTKDYLDAIFEFRLDPQLANVSVKSPQTFISIKDLQELIAYFENHITRLQNNPDSQSEPFVTWELGFQVQALSGEIRSPQDGEFDILFMVNVGQGNEEVGSTYVGGESAVTLENIQRFISSVRTALDWGRERLESFT